MRKAAFILIVIGLFACEKDINPDLEDPARIVVIDAWLNDKPGPQNIFVSRSQPYFDNQAPAKVDGATVIVFDAIGNEYEFVENDSAYTWMPADSSTFGAIGMTYTLAVDVEGERYVAVATMNRSPVIDSIKFSFEEQTAFILEDFYLAEFVALDFEGEGDTYWIKAWKNGQYLNKPGEVNVAYDAGFTAGGVVDGQVFIQPVQSGINPFDINPETEADALPPYVIGDSVYVEIHSIDIQGFRFLNELIVQTDRAGGFGALFAQPLANVATNIYNANENSEIQPTGFFQVSSVNGLGKMLDEETAREAQEMFEAGL